MIALELRFLAGRYHATPWGAHVNEGLVEWPPSPWRVLRTLLAMGHTRFGWTVVPDVGRRLFDRLASVLPEVQLPPARAAHTRHYMPLFKEKTTKVLDTFAHVGAEAMSFAWDVDLAADERALLEALAGVVPYLGRAESWVECTVADKPASHGRSCLASESCPRPGFERVELLAPMSPAALSEWRTAAVAEEVRSTLDRLVAKAAAASKKPPKTVPAKEVERIEQLFPVDLVAALSVETPVLRAQGWTQPPGSRWVSYWRPEDALRAPVRSHPVRRGIPAPTTALFALSSDTQHGEVQPLFAEALPRLERLHRALVDLSDGAPVFTGKTAGAPLLGHRHASLIPLSLDRRAERLDHVLLHAEMGLDEAARRAVSQLKATYGRDLPKLFVTLVGVGAPVDFDALVPQVRSATRWISCTPFVPPRHPKPIGRNSVTGQVEAELASRGLPSPTSIEIVDSGPRFRRFQRARRAAGRAPPVSMGLAVRLTFAEPVRGPISLGYASHFGLGSFVPE